MAGLSKAQQSAVDDGKQTCPCCFRPMAVKNGKVVRHGWKEVGGGYGRRGWHSGRCYGVGYAPYETSCDGTKGLLGLVLGRLATETERQYQLQSRPSPLQCSYQKGWGPHAKMVEFELEDDGQSLDAVRDYDGPSDYGRHGSYGWHLKKQLGEVGRALTELRGDRDRLVHAVVQWRPRGD